MSYQTLIYDKTDRIGMLTFNTPDRLNAISELRLDIRPTNAPEGRSAQLHIAGQPVDKEVKAPVILDLNVNGPLEKLINMGLDSRLSIGSGK